MRVLVLTNMPTPYNDGFYAAVAARGAIDLHVLYCTEREANRDWILPREKGYSYQILPGVTLGGAVHVNRGWRRALRSFRPDVVVLSGGYMVPTVQLAAWTVHRSGRPWVYWGEALEMRDASRPVQAVRDGLRAVLRHADAVMAIGERACRTYAELGIAPDRIFNLHYYPNVEQFALPSEAHRAARRAIREAHGIPADAVTFVFCGQLIHRKGVDTLLQARARLTGAEHAMLLIAGDGPERGELEAMAASFGVSGAVRWAGFVQPADLPRYFAAGDALVVPSRREGWGLVVGEAMASGLPVLASTEVNAARDLVTPWRSGVLFEPGDAAALAAAMQSMADDRALRDGMREHARAVAAAESPHRGAERLEAILRTCVASMTSTATRAAAEVA